MKQLPVPAVAAAATAADNHFLRIKRPALIAHSINKQIIIIMHMGGRGTSGNKMRMAYGSFAIILSFFLSTFLHSPPHSKRSNKNGTIKRNENAKKKNEKQKLEIGRWPIAGRTYPLTQPSQPSIDIGDCVNVSCARDAIYEHIR